MAKMYHYFLKVHFDSNGLRKEPRSQLLISNLPIMQTVAIDAAPGDRESMARLLHNFTVAALVFVVYKLWTRRSPSDISERGPSCANSTQISLKPQKLFSAQSLCVGEKLKECVPPFVSFRQQYRFSKKYSLLGCAIEKNFSTFLTAILCFLHDEEGFQKNNRTLDREIFHHRLCAKQNEATSMSEMGNRNWTLLAVIRDPVERFVSGFVDKCLREQTWKAHRERCNGCRTNLTCFVEVEYSRMMHYTKHRRHVSFDDDHFFPQSWRCEFASSMSKYHLLKLNAEKPAAFFDALVDLLQRSHVSDASIEFIDVSLRSKRTRHSTVNSPERTAVLREIRGSRRLTSRLVQMYFYDFVLFGFPLPQIPAT
ncbi:unnamed protein product [Caenorhabditis auriculariae]|uniref:Sulfotransferase domain-containing protein n=1 Tax=Caenorhabditis auriculariae TaxID=2777116 RepID=A0A8S1GMD2_9PELO|nr:unnamed protein product [Caenorhabditis auriculariae]